MAAARRHPLNVPGDFYVEHGCCTSCDVAPSEAPGHFAYDDSGHCYVCKQPREDDEVGRMVSAVHVADMDCIRYAGTDASILGKLDAVGACNQCDALPSRPRATAVPTKTDPVAIDLTILLKPGVAQERDGPDARSPSGPKKFWRLFTRR
jgi:hypothetical protein